MKRYLTKFPDEALCYIEPMLLSPSVHVARASPHEVLEAANELLSKCVLFRGKGGKATNIGKISSVPLNISFSADHHAPSRRWKPCRYPWNLRAIRDMPGKFANLEVL